MLRVQHQDGGNGDAFLLSVTEGGNWPVDKWGQSAHFQHLLHPLDLISSSGTLRSRSPSATSSKIKVLGDHLVGVLHHHADELGPFLDRFCLRYPAP